MFIGMLVNFHQYHLFGRILIQQIQPHYISGQTHSSFDTKKTGNKETIIHHEIIFDSSVLEAEKVIFIPKYENISKSEIFYQKPVHRQSSQRDPPYNA